MKVFKFYCGEMFYAFAAETKELAINAFAEETGDKFTICEEIPESEWYKRTIAVHEDNNFEIPPYFISIREAITGTEPQMIYTNDISNF